MLIKELIAEGVLKTPEIITAFQKIDRRDFVRAGDTEVASANRPLPIGYGQTISQPYTVAFMLELLQAKEGDRILDIGSGSGWQMALLANLVGEKGKVFALELIPELFELGKKNVAKYGFIKTGQVEYYCQNAINGLAEKAPFDKIIAAASGKSVPEAWKKQLKIGGRLVLPVGNSLRLVIKKSETDFAESVYPGFVFVPLVDASPSAKFGEKI
ncbi:MAG: protein-L-isoaspartate O-methyltransferase [Candidatus Pacebacteria bacterium]|nr:protein-L-isoaspartate O-methyltransferase [Candidatus Paceibacterota bacterium]